jgi:hypothetical protein
MVRRSAHTIHRVRRWSADDEPGAGVDAIAAIRVPGQGDFVTIGYSGFRPLPS